MGVDGEALVEGDESVQSHEAFNVQRKIKTFGNHGTTRYMRLRHFYSLEAAHTYLTEEQHCVVVGVEIAPSAVSVLRHPFSVNTAFLFGNEVRSTSSSKCTATRSFIWWAECCIAAR